MHALFDVYNRADAKINFIQPALTVNVLGHYRYSVKTLLEAFLRNKSISVRMPYNLSGKHLSAQGAAHTRAHTHTHTHTHMCSSAQHYLLACIVL